MRRLPIVIVLLLFVACGTTSQPLRQVTIDARDTDGSIVDPVNLWDNYQTRQHVVGHVRHGDTVGLAQQSGDGCEVRTATGTQGWVTCANFIKEFK